VEVKDYILWGTHLQVSATTEVASLQIAAAKVRIAHRASRLKKLLA
jgi:hypothetical protein